MSDLVETDDIDNLTKYGVLTKKEVFKWCIHASVLQNSADDKRSDFFTFGPSKGDKFYFQLPAAKNCLSASQFSVYLCRVPSNSNSTEKKEGNKIKVSLALLDLRDRLHNTCERVMEDCDKVHAVFDRSCYDKYHQTFLKNGFIVINCALDVNEVIQDQVDKETPNEVSFSDSVTSKDLIDDLSNLLEKGLHSDVILSVKGVDFPAHRAILSTRSPIFAAMFEHDTLEKEQNRIEIVDIPSNAVHQLLSFLYSGKTGYLKVQDALSLFIASDKYALPSLRKQCSNYLCSNLNTDILLNVLIVATHHQDDSLKNAAIQGVLDNAVQVLKSDEWLSFLQEYPEIANSIILQLAMKSQRD